MNNKKNKLFITGNEAIGRAAVAAKCRFYAGYPITPQNELTAFMSRAMPENNAVFIQAESELAAINMVFGASAAGARAMTSSSSPGISLKQEGISYIAGCKLPAFIVNVMRGSPGLGNIAPSQSDYFQATKGGGHGDYNLIVLAPASVQEAFDLTLKGFSLADEYRNPVMLLLDAFIAQMAEPVITTSGKPKIHPKPWALTGARGRPPNIIRSLLLKEGALEQHNLQLQEKYKVIKGKEVLFEAINTDNADIIFVAYGIAYRIIKEAALRLQDKVKIGIFRPISLWPFPRQQLQTEAQGAKDVFVFELSCGQMVEDVNLALGHNNKVYFYGRTGGGVFSVDEIVDYVESKI